MFQQLRRKMRRGRLVHAAVLLAAALLVLAFYAPGLALLLRGPADLYTLEPDQLVGSYAAARVDIIYDWYAETVRGDGTDQEETLHREYIIPVGADAYMGMEVPARQLPQAEAVRESTQAVMRGRAESLDGSSVVVTGTILRMDSQTQAFFQNVAGYDSFSPQDQLRFYPVVLVPGRVGPYSTAGLYLGLAAAACLAALGLALLARALLCRGPAQPRAYLQAIAGDSAPLLEQELNEFYERTPPLDCLRANCRWVLCEDGADSWLLYNRDIVWVYRTRHSRGYSVVVCARSPQARQLRQKYRLPSPTEPASWDLQERLRPLLPDAVFGYNPLWESLYRADPERFRQDVKAEQEAARAAAARRAAQSGWQDVGIPPSAGEPD